LLALLALSKLAAFNDDIIRHSCGTWKR